MNEYVAQLAVTMWPRRSRRLMLRWPDGANPLVPAFTIASVEEPRHVDVVNLALMVGRELVGRMQYRSYFPRSVYCGMVLSPAWRGAGIAIPAVKLMLHHLAHHSVDFVFCWV